jgi:hypothetical protein
VQCREACDALGDACAGIQVADGKPQCELLAPSPVCSEQENWQAFHKHFGTACTHVEDFAERAGALAITERVMVGIDYVLEPGKAMSLEVTVPSEKDDDDVELDKFRDRIMVIDCEGVCGISGPTKAAFVDPFANAALNSTKQVLHFPEVYFESGGTFKLCFCDSARLPDLSFCSKPADFAIEVGTVHSSGVSCLVAQPELQKAECVPHAESYGEPTGLRCYEKEALFPDFADPKKGKSDEDDK